MLGFRGFQIWVLIAGGAGVAVDVSFFFKVICAHGVPDGVMNCLVGMHAGGCKFSFGAPVPVRRLCLLDVDGGHGVHLLDEDVVVAAQLLQSLQLAVVFGHLHHHQRERVGFGGLELVRRVEKVVAQRLDRVDETSPTMLLVCVMP